MGLFDHARNPLGPLGPEERARIVRFLREPSAATWNAAFTVIITVRPTKTVWQAVCKLDPTFPKKGAADSTAPPEQQWPRFPDALTVARAIKRATAPHEANTPVDKRNVNR